jgi:hypothetical protein
MDEEIQIPEKSRRNIYIYNFITGKGRNLLCNYAGKRLTNFTHDSKGVVWRDEFARGLHIGFQPNRWAPHCISCPKVEKTLDFSLTSGHYTGLYASRYLSQHIATLG